MAVREVYLDIETTGLSPKLSSLTLVGLFGPDVGFVPLVAKRDLTKENLLDVLDGAGRIVTFNGARFDLPFIREKLGVDLKCMEGLEHVDLMYVCRRAGLRGGQKKIELQLGIPRMDKEMSGREAAHLGKKWLRERDHVALSRLLLYNEEDCRNLWHIGNVVGRRSDLGKR